MSLLKRYPIIIIFLIIFNTSTDLSKNINSIPITNMNQYYNTNSTNFVIKSTLQTHDNEFIIMGRTDEMSGCSYTLIKTDNQGIKKWTKTWGGDFHIYCIGECIFEINDVVYLFGQKKAIPGGQQPTIWLEIYKLDKYGKILFSNSSILKNESDINIIYLSNNELFEITEKYITKIDMNGTKILKIARN